MRERDEFDVALLFLAVMEDLDDDSLATPPRTFTDQ